MRGSAQAPGWITDAMALQLSVDEHILPPEFLPEDVTPAGMLTDSGDGSKAPAPTPRAPYAGQVTPPPPPAPAPGAPPAMKAKDDEAFFTVVAALANKLKAKEDDDEWAEAVKWAEEASKG